MLQYSDEKLPIPKINKRETPTRPETSFMTDDASRTRGESYLNLGLAVGLTQFGHHTFTLLQVPNRVEPSLLLSKEAA